MSNNNNAQQQSPKAYTAFLHCFTHYLTIGNVQIIGMKVFTDSVRGKFVRRINRFLVCAQCGEELLYAHCPNPGRMWEILLPGREIVLEKSSNPSRSTRYTLVAAMYRENTVLLHSGRASQIAENLIFPALYADLHEVQKEVRVGRSRLDFLINYTDRRAYVEVKACTLVEHGVAMFPDAPTERGAKHLRELAALSAQGYNCHLLFIIMHPDARLFVPNFHTDPLFSRILIEAAPQISIRAVSVRTDRDGAVSIENTNVPICLDIAERNREDRGAYLILIEIDVYTETHAGSLGKVVLEPGYYVYVGSAMRCLAARMRRHLSKRKKTRWHIDYITNFSTSITAIPIKSAGRIECALAEQIMRISHHSIPNFGSSDCRCPSHLYYFSVHPLLLQKFVDVLMLFRHLVQHD